MAILNDPDTRHLNWAREIPGDITLRLRDSYIPDFYRDLTVGGQVVLAPKDQSRSQLASDIGDADTSLSLVDASTFPVAGTLIIDDEQLTYTGRTGNVLTGLGRGANHTIAAPHVTSTIVTMGGQFTLEAFKNSLVRFVELCGPSLDYLLERAKDLPQLVQIDNAPWELLQYLGSMVGYHWLVDKDAEQQRKDIELFLAQCKIKGTRRGIERAVLKSGATRANVYNLSERIFTINGFPPMARFKALGLLGSTLDGPDAIIDPFVFRYGTYEIDTDLARPRFLDALMCYAHPAGTSFVVNVDGQRHRVVGSPGDDAFHVDFDVQTQQDVNIDVIQRFSTSDDADPQVEVITAVILQLIGIEVTGTADSEPTLPSLLFNVTTQPVV